MKRILFAINNKSAEQKLSKLIKENGKDEQYQVVGTLVSNESITDFLSYKTTDILVYIEGLNGKEDGFDYILKLHRTHPHIRIVFIAGQRSIGDKKLATLVAFHIYDIVAGQRILMSDVADKILHPAQFEDVMIYLPDSADLFRDSDFQPRNQSTSSQVYVAQNESERVAEKAGLLKQLSEAENANKSLSIRLSASETRVRELETERDTWREEASKERMSYEKSFEAEKKTLSATIIELNERIANLSADKAAIQQSLNALQDKYEDQSKDISLQQTQSSISLKGLQNDLRVTRVQLEEKTKQYADLVAERDELKRRLVRDKDLIIAEAQTKANEILEEANARALEAEQMKAELQQKLALYGNEGFEAYKAAEEKRIEERKANLDAELAAERAKQEAIMAREHAAAEQEHSQKMAEAEALLESKMKAVEELAEKISQGEEAVRRAKQAEILKMDAAIDLKRQQVANIDAEIDAEVAAMRAEKMKSLDDINSTISSKQQELEQLELTKEDKQNAYRLKAEEEIEEMKKKTDQEISDITRAFESEKHRLAAEFEGYKKELVDKKAEADAEYGITYTFNERDFVVGPATMQRCVPVIFYSPVPGTGNSTMALNVATFIAMNNRKTIYIELNSQHPTLKDQLGISIMKDSIDYVFDNLRTKNFEQIDQNIITKQKVLNLKTSAVEMQARYPDMLHYLTYTEDQKNKHKITIDFIKGLIAYLKYKKHYEYIILDVPSYFDKKLVNEIYTLCNKYIVSVNQDILSMNNLINMKDYIQNLNALEKTYYVVNKYINNSVLGNRKIAEICRIRVPATIPSEPNDAILASYKSVPMILISSSRELATSYKMIAEHIMR